MGLLISTLIWTAPISRAQNVNDDLSLLKLPGHHAILRHALAPGMGDPSAIVLGDCKTQRNLDAAGRAQAARLGDAFRAANITPTKILSSGWCRCLETGQLMALGPVTDFEPLHSVWTTSTNVAHRRTAELIDMLSTLPDEETVVMISHSVNLSALTGRGSTSGGGHVIKIENGKVRIVGSIAPR